MRVLSADDQDFVRRGLRSVLSEEKDIEVCAEAVVMAVTRSSKHWNLDPML